MRSEGEHCGGSLLGVSQIAGWYCVTKTAKERTPSELAERRTVCSIGLQKGRRRIPGENDIEVGKEEENRESVEDGEGGGDLTN